MDTSTTRRARHIDELRNLCRAGALARAIDLAFAHFADFGRDDDIVALLGDAIDTTTISDDVRRRFVELQTAP